MRYHDKGQVICIADTGFDLGHNGVSHPHFGSRVVLLQAFGDLNTATPCEDRNGHGTHVSVSVAGDGKLRDWWTSRPIRGPAFQADLITQPLLMNHGGLEMSAPMKTEVLTHARNKDARVHNNSWASTNTDAPYDLIARAIDRVVHSRPDMVVVIAAGNRGDQVRLSIPYDPARPPPGDFDTKSFAMQQAGRIVGNATAKNAITVGATHNVQALSLAGAPVTNAETIFRSSSRGPVMAHPASKRIKPDVVAPGVPLLSSRLRHANVTSFYQWIRFDR